MINPNYLDSSHSTLNESGIGIKSYSPTEIHLSYEMCSMGMMWVASMSITPLLKVHAVFPCKPTRKQLRKAFKDKRTTRQLMY